MFGWLKRLASRSTEPEGVDEDALVLQGVHLPGEAAEMLYRPTPRTEPEPEPPPPLIGSAEWRMANERRR